MKMSKAEIDYLENQKDTSIARTSEKKLLCFPKKNDIDPVWEKQENRREKYTEYAEKRKKNSPNNFSRKVMNSALMRKTLIVILRTKTWMLMLRVLKMNKTNPPVAKRDGVHILQYLKMRMIPCPFPKCSDQGFFLCFVHPFSGGV